MIAWAAFRKELLEQWRSYRILIVCAVLFILGLVSPLLARYLPEILKAAIGSGQAQELLKLFPAPTAADAVDQYVKNTSQFGFLLALLMAMGAVAQEKERGTAALMLSKPLTRSLFLLAKFAALALTFTTGLILAGAAAYYYTTLLFGPVSLAGWLALTALFLVNLLVYVALTLLCSTLARSQVVAAGAAFGLLILLSLAGSLPRMGDWLPNRLLAWGSGLAKGSGAAAWPALWVSLGLIAASLVAAWLILRRQEL